MIRMTQLLPLHRVSGLRPRISSIIYAGGLFVLACLAPVHGGVIFTWLGGTGNYESSSSWSILRLPGQDDDLVIDGGLLTTSIVSINSAAKIHDLFVSSGDSLRITNGNSLTLFATAGVGSVSNNGTISLVSTGSATDLSLKNGTFTFSGTGSLTLSNNANNRIYGNAATDELANASGHTIRGSGEIGVNSTKITNAGTIIADQSERLVIDPNAGGLTNTGTLRATSGATLELKDAAVTNTGGLIEAQDKSFVDLNGTTITGGTLTSISEGHFHALNNSTLSGLTISSGSKVEVADAQKLSLTGTIQNAGTIKLLSSGSSTDLTVASGTVTLTGGGNVTLSDNTNNRITGASGTTLINANNTISGAGQIGAGLLLLDNRATISANSSGRTLTVNPAGTTSKNTGTLQATNGGTLRLDSATLTNTGGTIKATGASAIVEFSNASVTGGTLSSDTGGLLRNVASGSLFTDVVLAPDSTLQILNGTSANFAGTFTNRGTLSLLSSGDTTNFVISGNVTLDGSGTISLGDNAANQISASASTNRLTNANNTIQGSGNIGGGAMGLLNQSTIKANQTNALRIDPGTAGATNTGLLRADSGATLQLQNGTFANSGGIIEAVGSGSFVNFQAATITNGTLRSSGGGLLRNSSGSTFTDVTLSSGSTLQILSGTVATFGGTLTSSGTVQLLSEGKSTDFAVASGGLTLVGGTIELGNNAGNRITGSATLVNQSATIRGSGQLGTGQLALTNSGTIQANQSTALTVDLSPTSGFTNQGTLSATSGGSLIFRNGLTNASAVSVDSTSSFTSQGAFTQTAGTTSLQGGTFSATSSSFQGGTLQGSGTLSGSVSNSGTLAPGSAGTGSGIGTFTFNQTLTLTSTSLLQIDIGSLTNFDRINAENLFLNGGLAVTFANGFQSSVQATDTFTIMSTTNASGVSGTFAGLADGTRFALTNGGSLQVNYTGNSVVLSNFLAIPEPSTYALIGFGAVVILIAQRRRRS